MKLRTMGSLHDRIIPPSELAPWLSATGLSGLAQGLLTQQKGSWELLRTSYVTLDTVRTRVFDFDGFQVKVQFNPGRMTSTLAKVDANSIRERKCFLCLENLPTAQRGILRKELDEEPTDAEGPYLLLCNPFPIFPEHFTIPSSRHVAQRIRRSFPAFLEFTRQLGDRYTVFYNGPKCGASAPDHLHFQAGNRSFLPIDAEYNALKERSGSCLCETGSLRVFAVNGCLRRFVGIESDDSAQLGRAFEVLYGLLAAGGADAEEPMLNVLGFFSTGIWRILVFPRVKHRPTFYFNEGDDQLLISPAAVELGGICTTPREQDFEKVTREHIMQMFEEVCLPEERFQQVNASLRELI